MATLYHLGIASSCIVLNLILRCSTKTNQQRAKKQMIPSVLILNQVNLSKSQPVASQHDIIAVIQSADSA